jgi:hypothetical protein
VITGDSPFTGHPPFTVPSPFQTQTSNSGIGLETSVIKFDWKESTEFERKKNLGDGRFDQSGTGSELKEEDTPRPMVEVRPSKKSKFAPPKDGDGTGEEDERDLV